jgi:hypothetical protein
LTTNELVVGPQEEKLINFFLQQLSLFNNGVFDETALRNTTSRDASESKKINFNYLKDPLK